MFLQAGLICSQCTWINSGYDLHQIPTPGTIKPGTIHLEQIPGYDLHQIPTPGTITPEPLHLEQIPGYDLKEKNCLKSI